MEKFIKPIVENSVKPNEIGKLEEFGSSELKNGKIIEQDLDLVKSGSLESLNSLNQEKNLDLNKLSFPTISESDKTRIKEDTGWSNEIIEKIKNKKQYEIYKNAGLEEREINGKKCLIKKELDFYEKNPDGKTNKERIEENLSPLGKDGKSMELHHIGQRADSPLAELTYTEHRKNYKILHDDRKKSEIDRNKFADERNEHWRNRSEA